MVTGFRYEKRTSSLYVVGILLLLTSAFMLLALLAPMRAAAKEAAGLQDEAYVATGLVSEDDAIEVQLTFRKYYYGADESASFDFRAVKLASEEAEKAWSEPVVEIDAETGAPAIAVVTSEFSDITLAVPPNGSKDFSFAVSCEEGSHNYYLVRELPSGQHDTDRICYLAHVVVADGLPSVEYRSLFPEGAKEYWNYGSVDNPDFISNDVDDLSMTFRSWNMSGQAATTEQVSVYPVARTSLNGGTAMLKGGDFAFYLHDMTESADGATVTSTTNDETGNIAFFNEGSGRGLVFTEPGTYTYEIRQHVPDDTEGVTYDTEVAKMVVTVKAAAGGSLNADVAYEKGGQAVEVPEFRNTKDVMDLQVYKVSRADGKGLAGCTYALWKAGSDGQADVMVQEAVSDSDGRIVFNDVSLQQGASYYYKEVQAPAGHTINPYRTDYFKLSEDGKTVESAPTKVTDDVTRVYVNKLDADTHDFVKGAKMAIIRQDTGDVVESWITDGATHKSEQQLDVNVAYVLLEVDSPDGYSKVDDTVFKINAIEGSGITVISKDETTELSGATGQQDSASGETTGSYVLTLYDKADASEKQSTVKETRGMTGNTTTRAAAPKTGDETPLGLVGGLAIIGLVAICGLQLAKKRVR